MYRRSSVGKPGATVLSARRGKRRFSNLAQAILTLFQLLTLDQWFKIRTDIVKEAPSSALYLGIYELVRGKLNGAGGLCAGNPPLGY